MWGALTCGEELKWGVEGAEYRGMLTGADGRDIGLEKEGCGADT